MKCIERSVLSDDLDVMILLVAYEDGFYDTTHLHMSRIKDKDCQVKRRERAAKECGNE